MFDSLQPHGLLPTRLHIQENFQARILEWVAISFSRASSQPRNQTCLSCICRWIFYYWATKDALSVQSLSRVWLSATPSTIQSMEFSRPEYWSGYPLPSLEDLPNPGLPHCRILYQLSHKGSSRILEWVAYSFSRASSQPRNQTRISCIVGRFFANWATMEAQTQPDESLAIVEVNSMRHRIQGTLFCILELKKYVKCTNNDSSVGKEYTCNSGNPSSIPDLGRFAGEGMDYPLQYSWASLVAQLVKNPPAMQDTWIWSLGWEWFPGERKVYPLQYSGLENSMDYIVHGITKSWTWLSDFHFHLKQKVQNFQWCWK